MKQKRNPVASMLQVGLTTTNFILILFSISILCWQGYQIVSTYISQPISTEQKLLPLDNVPNIHMSICKSFEIMDCKLPIVDPKKGQNCNKQQLPAYFKNQSEKYKLFSDEENPVQFQDMMTYISVWNEYHTMWRPFYDGDSKINEDEKVFVTQEMYPYMGNNTLCCYTLKKDIRFFAPMLKLQRKGNLLINSLCDCLF